jgi:hypothetical protein
LGPCDVGTKERKRGRVEGGEEEERRRGGNEERRRGREEERRTIHLYMSIHVNT